MRIESITNHGRVACVFTDDEDSTLNQLTDWASASDDARLVGIPLANAQRIDALTDSIIANLAESLLLLWPQWYDKRAGTCEFASDIPRFVAAAAQACPEVQLNWLREASRLCQEGRRPVARSLAPAIQARQLGLALGGARRVVAMFSLMTSAMASQLIGISRSAEWLAREADVAIVLILPHSLRHRMELDGVNFTSMELTTGVSFSSKLDTTNAESTSSLLRRRETKYLVSPILGRPHPGSPGELRLAQQLSHDDELRSLFQFNVPVISKFKTRFLVDLLWQAGGLVVEIDGYGSHSKLGQFNADRQRDYELLVSDYIVLRLPHDFVVEDPALACERIRDVVRFRQKSSYRVNRGHV